MIEAELKVPTGPIEASRWSIEPITHFLHSRGSEHSLRVRTAFLRVLLTFFLAIALFFPLSLLIPQGWWALAIAAAAGFGCTSPLLRFYRSLFCEITFDLARSEVKLRKRGRTDTLDLSHVVGFQVCYFLDLKEKGFIRYRNEFHQLIFVYEEGGEIHRRLITGAPSGEIDGLLSRLQEHVKINVTHPPQRRASA